MRLLLNVRVHRAGEQNGHTGHEQQAALYAEMGYEPPVTARPNPLQHVR
jgi:hypothetical protein